MRFAPLVLAVAVLAFAAACGGGGAGGQDPFFSAKTSVGGAVTTVDGSTAALGGVNLRLVDTAERVVTAPDGSFRFQTRPTGTITLEIEDGDSPGDDSPDGDDADDSMDAGERRIEIRDVRDGERVDVRMRLVDGRVVEVSVSRSTSTAGSERELEIDMRRTAAAVGLRIEGEVELEVDDRGEEFEVEVEYAPVGLELRTVVIAPDGAEDDLGVRLVNALGEAEWERETKDGQRLPFGVASVLDLTGYTVEVRDVLTGDALLVVTLPELPDELPVDDDSDDDDSDDDDSDDDDSDDDDSDDDDSDDSIDD